MTDSATGGEDKCTWDSLVVWEASGFLAFLQAHAIQRSDLIAHSTTGNHVEQRFFRLKRSSRHTEAELLDELVKSLSDQDIQRLDGERNSNEGIRPIRVDWLPHFYSLPVTTPLARIDLYRRGELYGIDISSGYAVTLLNIQPGEHVLDLCCAPGAKLTMIADMLGMRGSVTGVDFSRQRLSACKQLVHKYKLIHPLAIEDTAGENSDHSIKDANASLPSEVEQTETSVPRLSLPWRCRLFHADGRTFNIGPKTECDQIDGLETLLDTEEIAARGSKFGQHQRKRKNKSARARDRKRPKLLVVDETLYDKVLVDAECTHDGSIRHLQRLDSPEKWETYVADHLNIQEINRILKLQHDLIRNGFKMLKAGGTMIYSTCSLSIKQNEDIVSSFLEDEKSATIIPISRDGIPCQEGRIPGSVRFTPSNHTSGLFIAKIRKADIEAPSV